MKWRNLRIYLVDTNPGNIQAGVQGNPTTRLKFLLSFYYYRKVDLEQAFGNPRPQLMADSGAFSALTLGAPIDINEYALWIKRWEPLLETYANLDVIGNAGATLDNQHRLEDMGLHPLPVFHVNEPWEYLEHYLEKYNYIALGGLVGVNRMKGMMPWLVKAFRMLRPGQYYHGFGLTSWPMLAGLPWGSVDSSSWGSGYRYGSMPVFSMRLGKFVYVRLGDASSCFRWRHLFVLHGFHWQDFGDRSRYDQSKVIKVSATAYMKAEDWLTQRHNSPSSIYLAGLGTSDLDNVKGVLPHV